MRFGYLLKKIIPAWAAEHLNIGTYPYQSLHKQNTGTTISHAYTEALVPSDIRCLIRQ